MSKIGHLTTQNQGTERSILTKASGGEQAADAWVNGVFVVPLLWLTVMGYQALMLMLKVVNRERPTTHMAGAT